MYGTAKLESGFQQAVTSTEGSLAPSEQFVAELLRASLDILPTNREAATHYISRAFTALHEGRDLPKSGHGCATLRGGLVPWQIKRVTVYIDANLEKQLCVRELAALVRLGPGHFQRAFRRSFGVSPHAYLVGRRVRRAQEIMLQSNAPLAEVALAVGFSDQAHLTTRFHRDVGVTPAVWRRERGGRSEGIPGAAVTGPKGSTVNSVQLSQEARTTSSSQSTSRAPCGPGSRSYRS